MLSRRELIGGAAALAVGAQRVEIGVQSFSFRDRPLDDAIKAMQAVGCKRSELYQRHVEPPLPRAELRKWRTSVSMDEFRKIRRKFDAAGIQLDSYYYNMRDDYPDEEIACGFEMAKALGVKRLTSSCTIPTVPRIVPYAARAGVRVGLHNHSNLRKNDLSTPENFAEALKNGSQHIGITLDIGHFAALGYDPAQFIEEHRQRILGVHIKDRKKNNGADVPFGEGDTPIGPVLKALNKTGAIPGYIECEHESPDMVEEVRRSLEYCRRQLL
jgi:sugar phosphate isomerase/epimerase